MKPKVFIVDDVEYNLILLEQIFLGCNYDVRTSISSKASLKILESYSPDIFLIDVMMPEMNGFDLCVEIKKIPHLKKVPILFISAISEMDAKLEGLRVGAVDYIIKPFENEEVIERTNIHLKIYFLEKENEKMIDSLNQTNKEKDRLMSIISHDMKSPITSIMIYSEIMKNSEKVLEKEKLFKYSNSIYDSCRKILEMINELNEVSKISANLNDIIITKFKLIEFTKNLVNLAEPQFQKKNIDFNLEFQNPDLEVNLDERKLNHIFSNLISNSIKFTDINGKIKIKQSLLDNKILKIEISDNGVGIAPELIPTLFDKFSKSQRKGTLGEVGSGLGMFITKDFVENLGGKISVKSELNLGTKVYLEFYNF